MVIDNVFFLDLVYIVDDRLYMVLFVIVIVLLRVL